MKKIAFFLVLAFGLNYLSFSQQLHDFGLNYYNNIGVVNDLSNNLDHAWVGGLNFCQFSSVDLNFDGNKELFVFDKCGNKKLVFINNGTPGSTDYTYHHEMAGLLPQLEEWAFFLDFNNDGLEDIFSYTAGGIAVYKNLSSDNTIEFKKITEPFIYSLQGTTYTNLYSSPVDLPGVADLDNDGDYDILTFFVLGMYVQFHKNMSMEHYGHADSLVFELEEYCWGDFAESEDDNQITLDIVCPYKKTGACFPNEKRYQKNDRHAGSTFLVVDLDADNDKDILLGDMDYPTLFKLINGGTPQEAHMVSQDSSYPGNNPVNLYSFPAPSYVDINNDNIKDLVISPFDEKTYYPVSDNEKSVWLYINNGANNNPDFEYQKDNFLQDQMIEVGAGAYPVTFDYNNDGLMDIFISNFGYRDSSYYEYQTLYSTYRSQIALLENTGTINEPSFQIVDMDFGGFSSLKLEALHPTFADIDNDNDYDLITGCSEGTLLFFENISQVPDEYDFLGPIENYQSIDVGDFSTPQLIDMNRDGLIDLVSGNREGILWYFENTGTQNNPNFELVTQNFGDVDVCNHNVSFFGFSVPCFFEGDNEEYKLFVGSESGKIFYYKDIEDNLQGAFTLFDGNLLYIYEGIRSGVAVHNFDNDEYLDMVLGNYAGGITYYKGEEPPPLSVNKPQINGGKPAVKIFPMPANHQVYLETGKKEMSSVKIYDIQGNIVLQKENIFSKQIQIDVSSIDAGVYFLSIRLSKRKKTMQMNKKLVITR